MADQADDLAMPAERELTLNEMNAAFNPSDQRAEIDDIVSE